MSHSFWCSFQDACCLTFQTSTMQKPRVFCSFSDKNFATDPKIAQSQKHEKHGICDTFAKMLPKNKNKKHGKTKTPKRRLVHENLAKHRVFLFFLLKYLPNINDAPGAAADARASLLLLLLLTLLMLLLLRLSCCRLDCCCSQRFFHVSAAASRSRSHSHR